jgi:hypothetical protein
MNLQGRDLIRDMQGDDVALLHRELRQLGAEIPDEERERSFFGAGTFLAVVEFQRKDGLEPTGRVDAVTAEAINQAVAELPDDEPYIVRGIIRDARGKPVVGAVVRAFDRDLRSFQQLGGTETDRRGRYTISYTPDQFNRAEKRSADLAIRVFDKRGQPLYEPTIDDVLFNAPHLAVINIQLDRLSEPQLSEFERLRDDIRPLIDPLAAADLREDDDERDITFLQRETGWSSEQLQYFAVADRLARETDLPAEFFYALLREQTVLRASASSATRLRFTVTINSETLPLLYDMALLDAALIQEDVTRAIAETIIAAELAQKLQAFIDGLARFADAARAYAKDELPERIIKLIEQQVADGRYQEVLSILSQDAYGDIPGLLAKLSQVNLFRGKAAAANARARVALGDLFGFDSELVERVQKLRGIKRPSDVPKLARLNRSEWRDLLHESRDQLTADGAPIKDRQIDVYASALVRRMEQRYPTAAFAAQLERTPHPAIEQGDAIVKLVEDHPDFELGRTNVTAFFKQQRVKLPKGRSPEAVQESLKTVQRVFKLAPSYRQTSALLDAGIRSAAGVVALGETQFLKRFAEDGPLTPHEARAAYRKAVDIHTATALLAADLQATASAGDVFALGGPASPALLTAVTSDFPNLKSLFQQIDLCACEHCRSVYSPAAYLADVLQFLKNRLVLDTTSGSSVSLKIAKDVLFARRPDLGDLDLSCANTNTPLPYIDLVCELLEQEVAPDPGIAFSGALTPGAVPAALLSALSAAKLPFTAQAALYGPDAQGSLIVRDRAAAAKISPDGPNAWTIRRLRQTTRSAPELAAAPEYLNEAAYTTLQASRIAFQLPFDLFHRETGRYFERFDIRRADLMRALQLDGDPADATIAADAFGLSDVERALITVADAAGQHTYWNTGATPAVNALKVVDTFLTKTGLSYAELAALLACRFINPNGALFVTHLDNTCDTQQKEISGLNAAALDRIHRFVRLWKRTGWPLDVLDRAIMAPRLGQGKLDDACLVRLEQVVQLQARLNLTIDELVIGYGLIAHDGDDSRYARVFLNRAANGSVDEALLPANVLANEQSEQTTPGSGSALAAVAPYLALALGASQSAIDALVAHQGPNAILSFANLAAVYAHLRLAQALGLSAPELLTLEGLTAIEPLDSPAATLHFAAGVAALRDAGVSAADLQYLLQHQAAHLAERNLSDAAITALLSALQAQYQAAFAENRSPFDPALSADEQKGLVKQALARLPGFDETSLSRFETILDDTFSDPALTAADFIAQTLGPRFDVSAILSAQAALAAAAAPKEAERNALIEAVLAALATFFLAQTQQTLLLTAVQQRFKLDETLAATLLTAQLKAPAAAGSQTLAALLTSDALIDPTNTPAAPPVISPATFPHQYQALRLLHKMTLFVRSARLQPTEVAWLLAHSAELGWLELDRLPYDVVADTGDKVSFEQWLQLQDALALLRAYPPVGNPADPDHPLSFPALLELALEPSASRADVLTQLAALTGWDAAALDALDQRFGFSAADLLAYRQPETYRRLETAATLLRRLNLDLDAAVALIKPTLTADDAQTMRQALKARYAESEWLEALQSIQDPLREQKRDALVAYLLAVNPDVRSSADLYESLLIDVEMSACQPTSRIVQAHGAVQLFVMRCQLGLEPQSVADVTHDADWRQWQWMQNYRVWEANRKVFLYPENWIEPELRDDKSFLFEQVETTLLQNELNERTVEDATIAYLEQLDELALLEVVALYYQAERFTMHVFARTKGGDPALYYYRRFERERVWTPWEKVDLDITGNHLLAFMRNSRLYLAWPIFAEEPNPDQSIQIPAQGSTGQEVDKAQKRWKIQLAVSELSGKRWLPRKTSQEGLYTRYYEQLPKREDFSLFALDLQQAGYTINCLYRDSGKYAVASDPTYEDIYLGTFQLTGCKGYPEPFQIDISSFFKILPQFKHTRLKNLRYREQPGDEFDELASYTLLALGKARTILERTPGTFQLTYPHQLTLVDAVALALALLVTSALPGGSNGHGAVGGLLLPMGTFMPYFYEDGNRGYVAIPGFYPKGETPPDGPVTRKTFSDILQFIRDAIALGQKYLKLLEQDPNHDLQALLEQLVKDPEYLRLREELEVYRTLRPGVQFKNFYHPLVCQLRTILYRDGIPALMQRATQLTATSFDFNAAYGPTPEVVGPYPSEEIDFDREGGYAGYNWELFFHLPLMMAVKLSKDQRFEEALAWFHYIFNPIGAAEGSAPQKYWVTKPFFEMASGDYLSQRIDQLLYSVAADPSGATISELKFAIGEWRSKPFMPHVIARSRPVAYQKAVLLKYIDNLIDWGDWWFRQDTMEALNRATQLYALAERLLGPKPRIVPPVVEPPAETYNQLELKLDLFGNALLELETLIPDLQQLPHDGAELPAPPITLSSLYFCIPPNDQLLERWDRVADRLFKLRHCQNIEGVERVVALFAPPIDPGALVRAAAAGLDIGAILSGMSAPLPHYRFTVMAQKATELTQQVNMLGAALLQALEKKDGEALARLRSDQELRLLRAVKAIKEEQIKQAEEGLAAIKRGKAVIEERRSFYAGQEFMNPWESAATDLSTASTVLETAIAAGYVLAGGLNLIPQFVLGVAGFGATPTAHAQTGGQSFGDSASDLVQSIEAIARSLDKMASLSATQGSYQRRQDEWGHQVRLAERELLQIEKQIATADIQVAIAKKDLENHLLQTENAQQADAFMRSKFTNQELYEWMIGQLSTVYFRAYQLAFDVAKKAERCFRHELGSSASFLQFGYWDSLRRGLLAADQLFYDIKRMETAYLDQNKREYELTTHVSLAQLDPLALIQLKNTGKCTITLPEARFDLEHPGHYMRRIKAVSLSIPCVAGPYTAVSAKLSLVSNKYRKSTALTQGAPNNTAKYVEQTANDARFVYNVGAIQSIATSQARDDSGMFEFSYRDERYLPFEGAGAISTWQLELPATFRQFDYATITDVILHLRYSARDGGSGFKNLVEGALKDLLNQMVTAVSGTGLYQAYDLRHELPNEWRRLKQQGSAALTLTADYLPFYVQGHAPAIQSAIWLARMGGAQQIYTLSLNGANFDVAKDAKLNVWKGASGPITLGAPFTIAMADAGQLEELVLLINYTVAS